MDGDTQEMKNQDGIVIKPGQEWLDLAPFTVIGLHFKNWVVVNESSPYIRTPESFKECQLITSHDGADLDAARKEGWLIWVEGMEIPDKGKMSECEQFDSVGKQWNKTWYLVNNYQCAKDSAVRYKLKAEEPEQPQYKLFEIDWDTNAGPCIWGNQETSSGLCWDVTEYPSIDGYRVGWGYTDNPGWCMTARGHYELIPCDHTGNRKYSIGRLEK
jgi:hypothetical protein